MNDSKNDKSIFMVFACGIEFDREAGHEVLWANDEEQAREIYKSQSDRCFNGYCWGGGEWGPEWDKERTAFVVALLRVPESWRTLMEEGEGQICLPKGKRWEVDDELHRYMVEAEAVAVKMTPASNPETHMDCYSPKWKSQPEAIEKAISTIEHDCFNFGYYPEDGDMPDSVCPQCIGPATCTDVRGNLLGHCCDYCGLEFVEQREYW